MTFRPTLSTQLTVTTVLVSVVLLSLGIFLLALSHQYRDRGGVHYVFLGSGTLMLLLLVGSLSFRIRSYEINSGNLIIKVGFGEKTFPLKNLQDIRVEERPFAGARKDMGVGGLWSYYGHFTNPRWGKFLAYATDSSRGVLLVWPDKQVLITPADAPLFIQSAKSSQ